MKRYEYILITIISLALGLIILKYFNNSPVIRGLGGDFLVVIFLYGILKSIIPGLKPVTAATSIFLFSVFVELLQLLDIPELMGIKNRILLIITGSTFDPWDILSYFFGILFITALDISILIYRSRSALKGENS